MMEMESITIKKWNCLTLELEGENIPRLLSCFQTRGYPIYKVRDLSGITNESFLKTYKIELTMRFQDFLSAKDIFHKCHVRTKIKIKNKSFLLRKQLKTLLIFIITAGFFLFLSDVYSKRIWTIQIDGAQYVSKKVILEDLKKHGIYPSVERNKIDSSFIVTTLREDFDEITWASVTKKGTFLIVSIKENTYHNEQKYHGFQESSMDIVANKEGLVSSMIVRSGTPHVSIGDAVKPGDILVSGTILFTDNQGEEQARYLTADATVCIEYEKRISVSKNYNDFPDNDLFNLEQKVDESLENSLSKIILTLEEKGVTIKEKNVTIESNYEGKTLYCTFLLQETVGVLRNGYLSDGN